jgi:hypothetical protein
MDDQIDVIVQKINKITAELTKKLDDPDGLSLSISKLAVLNARLGDSYVEVKDQARQQESYLKYVMAIQKRDLVQGSENVKGISATLADSIVRVDTHEELMKLNELKKAEDLIRIKRSDTSEQIDAHRTRVSLIKGEVS